MSRDGNKKEIADTYYRKDGVKTAVIPWLKEFNEKLVGGIKILAAHAVEMEIDSGEYERVNSIQVGL